MSEARGEITIILDAARAGDTAAWQRLAQLVYDDLRRVARGQLAGRREATLDTTGLVHECYLKLAHAQQLRANDRAHFFALAARVMRQVIVDRARERLAQKRGGNEHALALDDVDAAELRESERYAALDDALNALAQTDARRARVVECRFFAGLSEEETAEALGVGLRSVQRDWQLAREWLRGELGK